MLPFVVVLCLALTQAFGAVVPHNSHAADAHDSANYAASVAHSDGAGHEASTSKEYAYTFDKGSESAHSDGHATKSFSNDHGFPMGGYGDAPGFFGGYGGANSADSEVDYNNDYMKSYDTGTGTGHVDAISIDYRYNSDDVGKNGVYEATQSVSQSVPALKAANYAGNDAHADASGSANYAASIGHSDGAGHKESSSKDYVYTFDKGFESAHSDGHAAQSYDNEYGYGAGAGGYGFDGFFNGPDNTIGHGVMLGEASNGESVIDYNNGYEKSHDRGTGSGRDESYIKDYRYSKDGADQEYDGASVESYVQSFSKDFDIVPGNSYSADASESANYVASSAHSDGDGHEESSSKDYIYTYDKEHESAHSDGHAAQSYNSELGHGVPGIMAGHDIPGIMAGHGDYMHTDNAAHGAAINAASEVDYNNDYMKSHDRGTGAGHVNAYSINYHYKSDDASKDGTYEVVESESHNSPSNYYGGSGPSYGMGYGYHPFGLHYATSAYGYATHARDSMVNNADYGFPTFAHGDYGYGYPGYRNSFFRK